MRKTLFKLAAVFPFFASFIASSGVVVDSTRHLFKEGSREISAQLENKDDIPYLVKSWVEGPEGSGPSFFMVTPPLFRLEAKQTNTVRVFPNAHIVNAPKDRESVYYFNVMSIPPTSDNEADKNKLQLAVRHRMKLVYRPKALQELSVIQEAKKLEWKKIGNKISIKNNTPFFIYFKSVKVGDREISDTVTNIDAYSTKEFSMPAVISGSEVVWKVATDNGGTGTAYSSPI